ncbi:hypothetical protein XI09_13690 [Bradyrhizobium sp. CCBAU 11386]|uniref:hypothetical protein n=1 Tax=Bradyrhizobium sp. CCBAU 11386 TaxID=1630837 RepID=UPI0023022E3F|nr:hypothetical protein [Bradyrhizobium sp. CCBAU 11386]MDA9505684.1 hypothetical protein [Bradyrhizobium sp. CCBAU 11386]
MSDKVSRHQFAKIAGLSAAGMTGPLELADAKPAAAPRVNNIFDNRYSTLGTFFDREALPNFANGGAEFNDPRSLSPARPRAFYAGMRVTL